MAKATVGEIFRAFRGAKDETDRVNYRLGEMMLKAEKRSEVEKDSQKLSGLINAFMVLYGILADCKIEIDIPPKSEEIVREWIFLTTPIDGHNEVSLPGSSAG